jgi:hypothetical protein
LRFSPLRPWVSLALRNQLKLVEVVHLKSVVHRCLVKVVAEVLAVSGVLRAVVVPQLIKTKFPHGKRPALK